MMTTKIILPVIVLLATLCTGLAQTFEGTISLHVKAGEKETTSVLTVGQHKTLLEAQLDTNEYLKVIKDFEAGTTTLLRKRDDKKYGFTIPTISTGEIPGDDGADAGKNVVKEITKEVKQCGKYSCVKIMFKNEHALSEAWVTKDPGFSLSKYFPEFVGHGSDPHLYELRNAADKEGFVMGYWEKLHGTEEENTFKVNIEEKEISDTFFQTGADYLVLDEDSMKRLIWAAQTNEQQKKQMEEFMELFGENGE